MIFHSLDFIAFFIAFVAVYWALPKRPQNMLLLAGSYFFYGYVHPWFLILIASSTVIDYVAARGMEQRPEWRRRFLWMSVISNFGMLGFFKYFNFFVENVHGVLAAAGLNVSEPTLRILPPVGISFYTESPNHGGRAELRRRRGGNVAYGAALHAARTRSTAEKQAPM